MADRQKVIQAFENCTDPEMNDDDETCVDCIRAGECPWDDCQERDKKLIDIPLSLAMAALELLKAQEPQTVIVDDIPKDDTWFGIWFGRCPNCKEMLTKKYHKHFCGNCGQEVKWDDLIRSDQQKSGD